jgi:integrase
VIHVAITKDEKRGTWTVQCWYRDWRGIRKKKTKRGFTNRKIALEWERNFLSSNDGSPTMTFGEFYKLCEEDMQPRLSKNTWETKVHLVQKKILPYFELLPLNEITGGDIIKWENELLNSKTSTGLPYAPTYLRSISNQLSAIFNHAVKHYNLSSNPLWKTGKMGSKKADNIQFWTKEEYLVFADSIMDKPDAFLAYEILYWTGIRTGELLALTPDDFDFDKKLLNITKSYQRISREDIVTSPKTPKSNRIIALPDFLAEHASDYLEQNPQIEHTDRIFPFTKSRLHHEMDRGSKSTGVKRIRVHDLRHSHVSLLVEMGFSVLAIADRMGHESTNVTLHYAHLFPNKQTDMARALSKERGNEA